MKAALGLNVKVSLPQAFHSSKMQSHKVLVKGVSTDIKQESVVRRIRVKIVLNVVKVSKLVQMKLIT